MKIAIGFSMLMLCLVTLSSTVLFWSSMPTDLFGKVLAGITATALEACKYSFFPAGIYYLQRRNPGGLGLLLIGVVLLGISVAATTGFLENAYNEQAKAEQQNSIDYQTKKQQLISLQQQINTLNNLVSADASAQYRTRALKTSEEVKKLESERNAVLAELNIHRQAPQGNAQSLFSVAAMALNVSPELVRQSAFAGLAIIIDMCAIAALLALGGISKKTVSQATTKTLSTESVTQRKTQIQKQETKKQSAGQLNEKERALANDIIAGRYGEKLSIRGIISGARINHASVKKAIEYLIEKNQVKREGNQYFLVQLIIA